MAEIVEEIKAYANLSKQYLDIKLETAKVKTKLAISDMVSVLILGFAIGSMVALALLIVSFGLAHSIGNALNDIAAGYYIVGGGYLLLVLILILLGKYFLKRYIQNQILRKLDEHE